MTVAEYNALQDRIAEVKKRIAALKMQMSQGANALREVYGMDLPTPETTPNSTPNDTSSASNPTPGVMAAHEQQPSVRNRTQLSPDEEQAFQSWYAEKAKIAGIDPDPDNPLHKYDYRGAFKAGIGPEISPEDGLYHWPSQFKDDDHPNRFVNGVDTKAGTATPSGKANVNPFQDNFTPSTNVKSMAEIASDISPMGKENLGVGEKLARGAAAIAPGLAAAAEGVVTKPIDTAVGFGKAVGEHALETSAMMSASPVSPTFPTRMILKGAEKLNVPILRDIERKLQGLEDQRIERYNEDPIQAPLDVLGIIGAPATAAWAIKASKIIKSVPKNIAEVMAKNATESVVATGKVAQQRERAFFELASEADPTITREEAKQWIDAINEYDAEAKSASQSLTKPTDIPADMQRMRTELESEMKTQAQKSPDVTPVKKQILKTKKSENLPVAEKQQTPQTITEDLSQPAANQIETNKQGVASDDVTETAPAKTDVGLNKTPSSEAVDYHGHIGKLDLDKKFDIANYPDGLDQMDYMGVHVGTKKAANARLKWLKEDGYDTKGKGVTPFVVEIKKPFGDKVWDEDDLRKALNEYGGVGNGKDKARRAKARMIAEGYDGILYKNSTEDKGSISKIAFSKDQLKPTSSEVTSAQPAGAGGTSRLDKPAKAESATASAGEGGGKAWSVTKEYKGSDSGKYRDYAIDGKPRDGVVTVELDNKNGYRIRNIFVDEKMQRKGLATKIYDDLNTESLLKTGKPLRSSEIGHAKTTGSTTLSQDGVSLWESFAAKGKAQKAGDHYEYMKPDSKPLLRMKSSEKPITPIQAAAEVKTEAAATSLTDKSFKQQMRAEISEAMKSAPDRPSELESAIKQSKDNERRSARYSEPETGDLFTEYSPSGYKSTAAETRAATKTSLDDLRKKHGIKTVTIEIPGDGTFKIEHTKQALEELNKRLNQKLETPEPKLQSEGFGGGSSDIGTGGLHEATINGHYVEVGDRSIRPSGTDGISTAKVDVYDDAAARKMGYITNNHYIVKTSAVSKQPKQVVIRGTELKTKELQDFLKQIDGVKFGDDATEVATFDINRGSASDATFNTVFHDGKVTATFNSAYIKYLKDNVDGFSLRLSGESGRAAIMSNGKRVGVIMPTKNTDATVERLIATPKKSLLKTKKPTETTTASAEASVAPEVVEVKTSANNVADDVLYHGTTSAANIFREGFKKGWTHLTDSKEIADSYQGWARGDSPATLKVSFKPKNPAFFDAKGQRYTDHKANLAYHIDKAASNAEKAGHDALVVRNIRDNYDSSVPTEPHTTVIAFDSAELKLADNPDLAAKYKPDAETPKPAKLSDKIKSIADKAEADAKARLKGKIDGLSSGTKLYDITGAAGDAASMGKDLAIIGAAKIARGAVEFAQWSKAMVDDLGESIRPHLEAIYKRANDEFESMKATTIDEDYIGLNKNQIAKIREATGLDDLPEPDRARHIDVLNRAKKNGTDKKAMDIARDVKDRPRPLTNEEHAGMVLKTEQLYSDWREATQAASDIIERGGNADDALVRVKALERDLDLLTESSDLGGREAARSLSIRRMLKAFETDDIIHVRRQATATKGSKLTPEESSQFEKLVAEKDAAIKRLDEANAKWQKDYDELQSKQAAALVEHEANRAKITEKIKVKREKIDAERVDILKQLRERGFETKLNAGLDPQDAFLIGKLGMNYVKGGITNVEEIVRLVMEDVPNLTRRDVLQSFNSKNPDLQAKAKAAAMIQVNRIKKQAELLVKIEDAENGIFSKTRKVLNTTPAEIKALQTKLRELRLASYETIRDADRLERIHKTITDAQNQLQGHYRNIKAKKPVDNEAVAELRGKLKDLRRQMAIEDELARLEDQLATGDFEIPTELKPRPKSELLDRAEIDLKRARRVIRDEMEKLRPKSPGEKLLRTSENLRAIKATADLSATLRQGAISVVSHPIKAAQNFVPSLKAAFSQYKAEQIDMAMRSSDAQYLRDKAKLELTNIDGTPKTREEHFAGVWIEKIPALGEVVKASNRHMATFLNLMRTSMFDDFVKKVPNATTEELQAYARWINVTTGRGELGKYAQAGRSLGTVFFAPRFAISRIQTPYVFYKSMKSSPRVRAQVAKEAVAVASTAMGVLALAKMSGAEVGTDPRESDFGKIRLGNERIDIFAGFQQPMRLIVRTGLYGTDKMGLTGDWLVNEDTGSLYSDAEFDPVEGWMRFAEFKLSPMITLPRELITGKTAVGEKTETIESLIRASAPMLVESMVEAWRDEGAGTAIRSGALNFMGVSSNVYADSQGRLRRDIRKAEYFGDAKTEDAKRDELTALKEKKKQEDQNKSGKITLNRKAI